MPLYNVFLVLNMIIVATTTAIASYSLAISIFGEKPKKKCCVLYCMITLLVSLGLNYTMAMFSIGFAESFVSVLWNISFGSLSSAILTFVLVKFHHTKILTAAAAVMVAEFVVMTVGNLLQESMYYEYLEEVWQWKLILYVFRSNTLPYILLLVVVLLIGWMLRRFKLGQYFAVLFIGRGRAYLTAAVSFILLHSYAVIRFLAGGEITAGLVILFAILILAALFGLQLIAMYTTSQDKIRVQEEIIIMQQQHLGLLEELQQEMRSFRHDFTNLMAGVTEQASSGDLDGIQQFLRNTSVYFDERLGAEIRQVESVANIQIHPLRSLLTAKIAVMQNKGIKFRLEVLKRITENGMRTEDLMRCVGILLDNAIEEAEKTSERLVNMVVLQEQHELYLAVANSYAEKPDLARIQQGGYSTKGKNRGTGIKSLKKIISLYPSCSTRMIVKDNLFRQELHIRI